MIGWWIVVSSQAPEERDRAETDARKAAILAQWEQIGSSRLDWLAQLVQAGKATQLSGNGYPNRYTARAGDVLPLLASGPPAHTGPAIIGDDYVMPANWRGKIELHTDRMAACPADQVLTIDA